MKDLHGSASATASAPLQRCLDLFEDVSGYPTWCPDVVREVTVVATDGAGRPRQARALVHAALGPMARDFDLLLAVSRSLDTVTLSRLPNEPSDRERFVVTWHAGAAGAAGAEGAEGAQGAQGAESAHIDLSLDATLDVPRLVPLGNVGDGLASGFVAAAVRALGGPATTSP